MLFKRKKLLHRVNLGVFCSGGNWWFLSPHALFLAPGSRGGGGGGMTLNLEKSGSKKVQTVSKTIQTPCFEF